MRPKSPLYDELVTTLESIHPPWTDHDENEFGTIWYFLNHATGLKYIYEHKLKQLQAQRQKKTKKIDKINLVVTFTVLILIVI